MVIIVMGVAGSGKTTVGELLAEAIGCHFYDGDDFHPPENVEKMAQGFSLHDADRRPWLASLRNLIEKHVQKECHAVIACSALKESYREQLGQGIQGVEFVYLNGSYDTIWARMKRRKNHFMKSELLQSQFDTLEVPVNVLQVDVQNEPPEVVNQIVKALKINSITAV